jgi:hypothetical protein
MTSLILGLVVSKGALDSVIQRVGLSTAGDVRTQSGGGSGSASGSGRSGHCRCGAGAGSVVLARSGPVYRGLGSTHGPSTTSRLGRHLGRGTELSGVAMVTALVATMLLCVMDRVQLAKVAAATGTAIPRPRSFRRNAIVTIGIVIQIPTRHGKALGRQWLRGNVC